MKLVGRVPVEPLDDERMTNIERRVVAGAADAAAKPMREPRRYFGFAMAAMAAMAAGVIGWKLGATPGKTEVIADSPVTVATSAIGGTLSIGDATIQSDPSTVFVVTRPDGGVLVDLSKGKVELEVQKRGNRPPLVVRAGDTDVIVVGTHFSVDYGDGTGDVDVRVTEGVVKVVRHKQEARVAMGQAWSTKRGVIALGEATALPNKATTTVAVAETTSTNATEPGAGSGATIGEVASGSGNVEIDMGKGPDVLHGRTAQVPDGRTPPRNGSSSAGSAANPDKNPGEGSGSDDAPSTDGVLDLKKLIRQQPVEAPVAVDETMANAVSKYQEMIRNSKTGEEESRAYYGIAYTQAMKIGRTDEALRTITTYERRFAQGRVYPERTSVAWLKVRILCGRGLDGTCRQAAAAYARIAPETPAGRIAERVTLGE